MDIGSTEYEQFRVRINRDVDGASAAVDAGDLDVAEARLEHALRTVRESRERNEAWQDSAAEDFHDGTGSNFHDGTSEI
jgi:hypothetical protein